MKKITMTLLVLAITLSASAQTAVDDLIAKLLKTYPKTPSREIIDKDPATGKLLRHITEYSFRDIKRQDFTPLVNALRDSHNGYFTNTYTRKQTHKSDSCVYELHMADADPAFRTVYILQTMGSNADLHVLYGKKTYSEMFTNFDYTPGIYYTIVNKGTGAKMGISFDYNLHASAYCDSVPSGRGPNRIVITDKKVFRFKFIPTVVVDTRFSDTVSEDCFIVTEDQFALEDGSETGQGQWLVFRYLDKNNPCQRWKLIEEDGTVTIINKATGRCVDLAGGETKEGASIFSYDINDDPQSNANQKWIIVEAEQ